MYATVNPENSLLLVVMSLVVGSPASAATWTPEDLVTAHTRGLPTETTARMVESVGIDAEAAVYLLRRGVPAETVRAWGYPVTEAEGMAALREGKLEAPVAVSDTDWREMTELPAGIERVDGTIASGDPILVVPERAILHDRKRPLRPDVVERAEARDVWVAAEPLAYAMREEIAWGEGIEAAPGRSRRDVLVRRGGTGVALGALLSVAGGVTFAYGTRGGPFGDLFDMAPAPVPAPDTLVAGLAKYLPSSPSLEPMTPDPILMSIGALGVVGGSVTLSFGLKSIRLAGPDRMEWTDALVKR